MAASAGVLETQGTTAAAWGDNGDGDLDLHVKMYEAPAKLYRNEGNGTFTDISLTANTPGPSSGTGAAWGDFDNDGDLDLFTAGFYDFGTLYRNDGAGTFSDVTAAAGVDSTWGISAVSWADFDNDGDLDLYLGMINSPSHLFENDGTGHFTDVAAAVGADDPDGNSRAAPWADYDRDGDLDLYLSNWKNDANRLLRSNATTSTGNHWLHLRLVGTVSNRDAIGARVRAVVAGVSQVRDVNTTSSNISQSCREVAVGLGPAALVESLSVRWPSGIVWDTTDVAADQLLTIVEGTPGVAAPGQGSPSPGPALGAPYPNPVAGTTSFRIQVARTERIQIGVYDVAGRRVRLLVPATDYGAGTHPVEWDGRGEGGRPLGPGVYHVRLSGPSGIVSRPVVLLGGGSDFE